MTNAALASETLSLSKIKIPHNCKHNIRNQLAQNGISKSFIYPNASSFAEEIQNKYVGDL